MKVSKKISQGTKSDFSRIGIKTVIAAVSLLAAVHVSGGDGGSQATEQPNLLEGNPLETLRDATCNGKEITRAAEVKSFSFRGHLRWAKPGSYQVLLSFTPKSSGSVTLRINTRTQDKWHTVAEKSVPCVAGEQQEFTLPVTIDPDSVGLNAIVSARLAGMTFHALEITPADSNEEKPSPEKSN